MAALSPGRGSTAYILETITMGAEPYRYVVPYEADIQSALDKLRNQVFANGEYHGVELAPSTPEEALAMADEDGTRSILDISKVTTDPDFCCAAPLSHVELTQCFRTDKPVFEQVWQSHEVWEYVDRGQARYVVVYDGCEPRQICFFGYSFD